ncbi:MAG: DUF1592 domain-containing protein [Myxococcota bacterium]
MHSIKLESLIIASLPLLATACHAGGEAEIDDVGMTDGETGEDESGDGGAEPTAPDCTEAGPRMIRRLSAHQLYVTLQAIFEDESVPHADVLSDPVVHGFRVDATEALVRDLNAQQLMQYAESVAEWAVANKLGQIASCQSTDPACRDEVIAELGLRFYREPLADAKISAYAELFDAQPTFDEAVTVVIATMMQSPYFLYRRELGADTGDEGRFLLTDYELASNLSYSLTNRPPDDELLGLAAQGALGDPQVRMEQFERLVASPQGQENLERFVRSWLEIDDFESTAKVEVPEVQFTDEHRQDMLAETTALFLHLFGSQGDVAELLSANYTFVNQNLGHFYRLWQANTPDPQMIEIPAEGDGARAPGILGHGSILARHALTDNSSPVARGVLVRRRLLCQELPEPPAGVDTNLQPIAEDASNRERYEQHSTDGQCSGCHNLIDPVGFAFEHYDTFGRYRDVENGHPIDASGVLAGLEGGEQIELDGLDSLAQALATRPETQACYAEYLSYYTYGLDGCNPEAIEELSGGDAATLQSTMAAIIEAPHFVERIAVK